jgi:hypothetical protein
VNSTPANRSQPVTCHPVTVILSEAKDLLLPVARVHFATTAVPLSVTAVLIEREAVQKTVNFVPLVGHLFLTTVTRVSGAMPRVLPARAVVLVE